MPTSKRDSNAITNAPLHSHVNTLSLAAWFIACFPGLVEDPKGRIWNMVPVLMGLQTAWCVLGVERGGKRGDGKKKVEVVVREKWGERIMTSILSLVLTLTLGTGIFALGLILFGAPVTALQLETLGCAVHMALLAGFPLVWVLGVDKNAWMEVVALRREVDGVYAGAIGTVVGAWLGAIPIPLDWDREWQKWPVTILAGAYAGAVVGKIVGSLWRRA
ncbi:Glycosylphosphatidylinositol (GPI) anchor assembly protein [Rhizina undulata]